MAEHVITQRRIRRKIFIVMLVMMVVMLIKGHHVEVGVGVLPSERVEDLSLIHI